LALELHIIRIIKEIKCTKKRRLKMKKYRVCPTCKRARQWQEGQEEVCCICKNKAGGYRKKKQEVWGSFKKGGKVDDYMCRNILKGLGGISEEKEREKRVEEEREERRAFSRGEVVWKDEQKEERKVKRPNLRERLAERARKEGREVEKVEKREYKKRQERLLSEREEMLVEKIWARELEFFVPY
jgi:hypothetical protein